MKKRLDELTAVLAEKDNNSKVNCVLSLLVALLSGVIIGMLISPRKNVTIASNNGNSGISGAGDDDCCCDDDCCGCDEECCCDDDACCRECDEERCCGEDHYCGKEVQCCEDDWDDEEESEESK